MNAPFQITVGGGGSNPAAGSTQWNDSSRAGEQGWIERTGYGPMRYEDYQVLPTGGIQLLNGLAFGSNGETYFWHATSLAYQTASSTYTNGFNYNAVINALMGRLGFRAHTETAYIGLVDSTNQLAQSFRYYNDFHALVTAGNLKEVQPDSAISNVNMNIYLQSLQKSVIMRFLNGVFSEKEYLEQSLLFDRVKNSTDEPITNSGKFVGFEIQVANSFNIAVQIDSAALLFDTNVTIPLYLFKDGVKTPVWTQSVNVVANENTVVNFSDLVLNYISAYTKGSRFYFGYFQSDLGAAKAIRQNACWNKQLCYYAVGIQSDAAGADFNRLQVSSTYESFGINLEISSFKDHTQAIVKKPNLFDEGIGLMMAFVVLEQILYSIRSNRSERLLKSGITEAALIQDLNGSAPISDGPPPVTGLNKRIEREMERVSESFYPEYESEIIELC
jgi:hypothetical protein